LCFHNFLKKFVHFIFKDHYHTYKG
jgi:hypothetical protein